MFICGREWCSREKIIDNVEGGEISQVRIFKWISEDRIKCTTEGDGFN